MTEPEIVSDTDARIGHAIKSRRKQLGMVQGDLSQAIGVSHQQVQKYEAGITRVSLSRLHKIAAALKTTAGDLMPDLGAPAKRKPKAGAEPAPDPLTAAIAGLSQDSRSALAAVAVRMK